MNAAKASYATYENTWFDIEPQILAKSRDSYKAIECFKFVGTGIHALQVARVFPTTSATYLPENDFFGLFPTWETCGIQLILLLAALGVVVYGRIRDKQEPKIPTNSPPPSQVGVSN